jgi:hypothetical protein
MYVAVTRAWYRSLLPHERQHWPLRRYVFGRDFARSVANAPVDVLLVVSICARLACRHPSRHDGAHPLTLEHEPREALDPAVAWWRALVGPDGLGVHYVELGGGTLEFLSVAPRTDQPDPRESR